MLEISCSLVTLKYTSLVTDIRGFLFSVFLYHRNILFSSIKLRSSSTWLSLDQCVLLYGAECRTVRKKGKKIIEKTETNVLRRIKGRCNTWRHNKECEHQEGVMRE